jgi:hypothetical protein
LDDHAPVAELSVDVVPAALKMVREISQDSESYTEPELGKSE